MLKELLIPLAQIVQTGFSVLRGEEPVFGTFSVAGKQITALLAWSGQLLLESGKTALLRSIQHFQKGMVVKVANLVFGKDEMITRKDIAARLHHSGMTASRAHRAHTRFFPTPVGKCGIEKLNEDFSYIL